MTAQAGLGLTGVLARAYRRAYRAGMTHVETDLVLCYVAVLVSALWNDFPSPLHRFWRPVRRRRAWLTDPPLPAWAVGEDDLDGALTFEVDAALRVAAFEGSGAARVRYRRRAEMPPMPVFTPAVRHAVYVALREAAARDVEYAGPSHLLVGLLALPDSAAYRLVVRRHGHGGRATIDSRVRADPTHRKGGRGSTWAVGSLTFLRVLPANVPRLWRWPWRAVVWLLMRQARRPYRRYGARYGHLIPALVESNAIGNAVREGRSVVTAAEVLISVIDLHEQLASAGKPLPPDMARWCAAGEILAAYGVQLRPAMLAAAHLPSTVDDAEGDLTGLPTKGWRPPRALVGTPAQGRTALVALRGASQTAHRLGHPFAGTSHLLVALLAEPDGPAARLLRELGVNVDGIRVGIDRKLSGQASE